MAAEIRVIEQREIQLYQAAGAAMPVIHGRAIPYGSWSVVMRDGRGRPFRERFMPGAFDHWLASFPDISALWNHKAEMPLGRTGNGTLRISKAADGLYFELEPSNTSWGNDAVISIQRQDIRGVSFLFEAAEQGGDTWERPGADGVAQRTVLDAKFYEISPVTFPAYRATEIGLRSVATVPEWEDDESDSRAADENTQQGDEGRAAVVGLLQHQVEILRRR